MPSEVVDGDAVEFAAPVGMRHPNVRQGEGNRCEGRLQGPCVFAPARGVPDDLPVAEVDEKAGVVPLGADPHAGGIRDDVRPRCAPVEPAGDYVGELGFVGLVGMDFELGLGVCAGEAVLPHDAPDAAPGGAEPASLQRGLYLAGAVSAAIAS